ncbi:hypothetical protein BH10PSE19_BH10PSE19_15700 [soil metagenome]
MKPLESIIKIANIHAKRLRYAIKQLKNKIPVSAETIADLPDEDVPIFELYASRFSKLQDFMGASLFPAVLEASGEQTEEMTFLDKLHKLEKLNLIPSTAGWMSMRQVRNSLAHEYPDNPQLMASFFNIAYGQGPILLMCLDKVLRFYEKLPEFPHE